MRIPSTPLLAFLVLLAVRGASAQDEYAPPVRVGWVTDGRIREISGMEPVSGRDGFFWLHNDSKDAARLFAIHQSGLVIAEVTIPGVPAIDWEDMAVGPGPERRVPHVHIADMGNNGLDRDELVVYRFPEPVLEHVSPGQRFDSLPPEALIFFFPDGPLDCEAFVVHPQSGAFYFISKEEGRAGVYSHAAPRADGTRQELLRLGDIDPGGLVTAADVALDGRRLLVRTYREVQEYTLPAGRPFEDIFFQPRRLLPAAAIETKSESICFDHQDRDYLTSNEGNPAPVHRIRLMVPQPSCAVSAEETLALSFVRGDVVDGSPVEAPLDVSDAVALSAALRGALSLDCWDRADVDDSGAVDRDDAMDLLEHLVLSRPPPPPLPPGAPDPTADDLTCNAEEVRDLIPRAAVWRYWSRAVPPDAGWSGLDADDSAWSEGAGGIGFGADGLATVLDGIRGSHLTLFARREFTVEDLTDVDALLLQIDYDDGFVAYVNGVEVAREGLAAAGFEVPFDQPAARHPGGRAEDVVLCAKALVEGRNVLALEVHNRALNDSALYFEARLRAVAILEGASESPAPAPDVPATLHLEAVNPPNLGDPGELRVLCDAPERVGGFSFVVAYDRSVFDVQQVEPGDSLLASSWTATSIDDRRGLVAVATVVAPEGEPEDWIGPGEDIELARLHYEVRSTGSGVTAFEFARTPGSPRLESVLTLDGWRSLRPSEEGLAVEVTSLGLPVVDAMLNNRGGPGTRFFVLGRRFELAGLSVTVCGRDAEFEPIVDGDGLQVVAPGCDAPGWAAVEICNVNGCASVGEGFLYTDLGVFWIRGDANGDGVLELTDGITMLRQLFQGVPASPACEPALDANSDSRFDLSDAVFLLRFLFQGSVVLEPPWREPAPCF